ncbi:MAG: hypothetical protein H0X51_09865 [Parachlamydiaceae bacterium]|nr:hypothetical protein [Parachlamydiaceae bacterium]
MRTCLDFVSTHWSRAYYGKDLSGFGYTRRERVISAIVLIFPGSVCFLLGLVASVGQKCLSNRSVKKIPVKPPVTEIKIIFPGEEVSGYGLGGDLPSLTRDIAPVAAQSFGNAQPEGKRKQAIPPVSATPKGPQEPQRQIPTAFTSTSNTASRTHTVAAQPFGTAQTERKRGQASSIGSETSTTTQKFDGQSSAAFSLTSSAARRMHAVAAKPFGAAQTESKRGQALSTPLLAPSSTQGLNGHSFSTDSSTTGDSSLISDESTNDVPETWEGEGDEDPDWDTGDLITQEPETPSASLSLTPTRQENTRREGTQSQKDTIALGRKLLENMLFDSSGLLADGNRTITAKITKSDGKSHKQQCLLWRAVLSTLCDALGKQELSVALNKGESRAAQLEESLERRVSSRNALATFGKMKEILLLTLDTLPTPLFLLVVKDLEAFFKEYGKDFTVLDLTDAGLSQVPFDTLSKYFPNVKSLLLQNNPIQPKDTAELLKFKHLEHLEVSGTGCDESILDTVIAVSSAEGRTLIVSSKKPEQQAEFKETKLQ